MADRGPQRLAAVVLVLLLTGCGVAVDRPAASPRPTPSRSPSPSRAPSPSPSAPPTGTAEPTSPPPSAEPDGPRLAYSTDAAVFIAAVSSDGVPGPATQVGEGVLPDLLRWSPDGSRLAYTVRKDRGYSLEVVSPKTGDRQIVDLPDDEFWTVLPDRVLTLTDTAVITHPADGSPTTSAPLSFRGAPVSISGADPDILSSTGSANVVAQLADSFLMRVTTNAGGDFFLVGFGADGQGRQVGPSDPPDELLRIGRTSSDGSAAAVPRVDAKASCGSGGSAAMVLVDVRARARQDTVLPTAADITTFPVRVNWGPAEQPSTVTVDCINDAGGHDSHWYVFDGTAWAERGTGLIDAAIGPDDLFAEVAGTWSTEQGVDPASTGPLLIGKGSVTAPGATGVLELEWAPSGAAGAGSGVDP